MRRRLSITASLALALICASAGFAAEESPVKPASMTSMAGLELDNPFHVDLKIVPGISAMKNKVDGNDLREKFTKRLTEAGFKLGAKPSSGSLEVRIDTDSAGEYLSLTLRFRRQVRFTANKKSYRAPADVWTRDFTGKINSQLAVIPLIGEQLLDQFIDDHQRSNAKLDLSGKVTAADPKFLFVVLDLGSRHGVEKNAEFDVERDGKVVGAIRVVRVEKDHSVANPIDGTDGLQLLEGDSVVAR